MTQPSAPAVRTPRAPSLEPQLQYRGFRNTPLLREYLLAARLGEDERVYVVGIPQAAFAARHVSLQDGPDICFQRLRRELTSGLPELAPLTITDAELAEYKDAHTIPRRPSFQPPPARPVAPAPGERSTS